MTIAELLDTVLPRLEGKPQCSVVEAVNRVQAIITNRLLLKRSTLVRDLVALNISAGDEYATITPSGGRGFLSIAGIPYVVVDGSRKYLAPFDSGYVAPSTAARPKYYERIGKKIYLYPIPDAAYVVTVQAYLSPATLTDMDEDLPFDGLLDDVFSEAVYGVMLNGTSAVGDKVFGATIDSQVDQVILAQDMADEQTMADSINYKE